MSYILDALKKADSERDRGHVPTLRDQPMTASRGSAATARPAMAWALALGGTALALAIVLAWRLMAPEAPAAVPMASMAPAETSAAPVAPAVAKAQAPGAEPERKKSVEPQKTRDESMPPPAAAAANEAPTPASSPAGIADKPRRAMAPAQITPVEPALQPAKPRPNPKAKTEPKAEPAEKSAEKTEKPGTQTPARSAGTQAASNRPASKPEAVALTDLPQALRESLPKLVISGATHSDNPAWRMLIINGQVFHEGDIPAADVQLEQIRPKSAVLNYKGQRFTQNY